MSFSICWGLTFQGSILDSPSPLAFCEFYRTFASLSPKWGWEGGGPKYRNHKVFARSIQVLRYKMCINSSKPDVVNQFSRRRRRRGQMYLSNKWSPRNELTVQPKLKKIVPNAAAGLRCGGYEGLLKIDPVEACVYNMRKHLLERLLHCMTARQQRLDLKISKSQRLISFRRWRRGNQECVVCCLSSLMVYDTYRCSNWRPI
jgi:hypothetical protein